MGMCLALHSVSNENIKKIRENPALVWRLIAPDDPDAYIQAVRSSSRRGMVSRLFGKKDKDELLDIPSLDFASGEGFENDLDKSWQGIHYCLNQTEYDAEPPMDFITVGGEVSGDVDVGYGPARFFDAETVKRIENRIAGISIAQLRENYHPAEMNRLDIYPNIWLNEGDEAFDYVAEYFSVLKSFVHHCSIHGLGMAVYLC